MRFIVVLLLVACSSTSEGPDSGDSSNRPAVIKEIDPNLAKKFEVKVVDPPAKKEEPTPSIKTEKVVKKTKEVKKSVEKKLKIQVPPKVKLSKGEVKSQNLWKKFSPDFINVGEESVMSATYLGINAANLSVKVLDKAFVDDSEVYRFQARARSAKFYSWVYELDDVVESFVTTDEFLPLKYSISQRETKKNVDHIEFYDRNKKMTFFRYKKMKDGKEDFKKEDSEIPYFSQDFLSCFFFVRGMPLRNGDTYLIPTTTKAKTWTLKAKVIKRERIRLSQSGYQKAIKLKVVTKYDGDLAKRGNIFIWLSNDKYRKILKFKSELKIGAVTGELISYKIDGKELL